MKPEFADGPRLEASGVTRLLATRGLLVLISIGLLGWTLPSLFLGRELLAYALEPDYQVPAHWQSAVAVGNACVVGLLAAHLRAIGAREEAAMPSFASVLCLLQALQPLLL